MSETRSLEFAAPWLEITATLSDWDEAGPKTLLKMLNHMHLIRAFKEEILQLDREGLAHGYDKAVVPALQERREY